jgi:hypothetical protein
MSYIPTPLPIQTPQAAAALRAAFVEGAIFVYGRAPIDSTTAAQIGTAANAYAPTAAPRRIRVDSRNAAFRVTDPYDPALPTFEVRADGDDRWGAVDSVLLYVSGERFLLLADLVRQPYT